MTADHDWWEDEPNIAMDKVIEAFAYRARLGAEVRIWQMVDMPMSKPPYRDLDLIECPVEIEHIETDGRKVVRPIEPGWFQDDFQEDELMEYLAKHPPASRYPMLETARNNKPATAANRLRYMTLASILVQPHEATAAAMEAQRALWEERKYRP